MAVLEIFSTPDGYIVSTASTYADARSGGGTATLTADAVAPAAGQGPGFSCWEAFLQFDTSVIGAGATIVSAELQLYPMRDVSVSDFVVQARLHDWGVALATADWVAGASLASKTLLAHVDSSLLPFNGYVALSNDALVANINKTGSTRMLLCSDRHVSGVQPSNYEIVGFGWATGSASFWSKLVVTTTGGAGGAARSYGIVVV